MIGERGEYGEAAVGIIRSVGGRSRQTGGGGETALENWVLGGVPQVDSQLPSLGDSFDLALDELAAIRHDSFGEKYLLVTRDGKGFWLTSNFGNRPWRFVEAIRQLRSEVEYVTT